MRLLSSGISRWTWRAKNDHLGFEGLYVYRGVVRKYRRDTLLRLKSGDMLVPETKGQDTAEDRGERRYLDEYLGGQGDA
jgi:type III restriction enzyme